MNEQFLRRIISKDFENLAREELSLITSNPKVFGLNKKNLAALERIVLNNTLYKNKDKVNKILSAGLSSTFEILSNMDKQGVGNGLIEINFRKELLENLNKMNGIQLCIFIDKVLKLTQKEKVKFFRHSEYSLHEINSVVSKSFGLTLTFEIFKPGKEKVFKAIDFNRIDRREMVNVFNNQAVRYLYVLVIITEVVLSMDEESLQRTKINKLITERTFEYINVIQAERFAVKSTGIKTAQTWTYNLCNLESITLEDEEEGYTDEL